MTALAILICLEILILIGSKKHHLSKKQTLFLSISLILTPIFWHSDFSKNELLILFFLSAGYSLYLLTKKNIILICLGLLTVYLVLANTEIINGTSINLQSTFWTNNQYHLVLEKFRDESTFLPYRLRGIIWGNWWPSYHLFLHSLSGGEYLWPIIGIVWWSFLILGLSNRVNIKIFFIIWLTIIAGWANRNPNLSLIGTYLLPPLITISISTIKKSNPKLLIGLLVITLLFLF
jgi:hypothetical protein